MIVIRKFSFVGKKKLNQQVLQICVCVYVYIYVLENYGKWLVVIKNMRYKGCIERFVLINFKGFKNFQIKEQEDII